MKIRVLKNWVGAVVVCCVLLPSVASYARDLRESDTGAGIILGDPTGFTLEHWIADDRALDFGLSFSLSNFFLIYADYLFHFPGAFSRTRGANSEFTQQLSPYIGLGGELFFSTQSGRTDQRYFTGNGNSTGVGIRIPLGLEWFIPRAPFSIFAEIVPGIGIIPSTFGFFQGGLGGRFYF